jgi:hypothetical protein
MALINARKLLQFPDGDNSTDVFISGIHLNRTTLNYWNYTLYSNNTISNGTNCWLMFAPYQPAQMLSNGTFVNATSCYSPIDPMGVRSYAGIAFACLFAASIVLTMVNLRKHGRLFLPSEKRFRAVGRRWQWYWMIFVSACGLISTITGIDVDRDYVPTLPIILQTFFYFLMLPSTVAAVWESVRHW